MYIYIYIIDILYITRENATYEWLKCCGDSQLPKTFPQEGWSPPGQASHFYGAYLQSENNNIPEIYNLQ